MTKIGQYTVRTTNEGFEVVREDWLTRWLSRVFGWPRTTRLRVRASGPPDDPTWPAGAIARIEHDRRPGPLGPELKRGHRARRFRVRIFDGEGRVVGRAYLFEREDLAERFANELRRRLAELRADQPERGSIR